MKIRFELPDEELQLNTSDRTEKVYEERQHNLKAGHYTEQLFEQMHISCIHLHSTAILKDFKPQKPLIQLIFCLKGEVRCKCRVSNGCHIQVKENQHNLLFFPGQKQQLLFRSGKDIEVVEISLDPAFFSDYLPPEHAVFSILKADIAQGEPGMVYEQSMSLNTKMETIIKDILHCKWKGQARRICAEAKIVELILLQYDQHRQQLKQDKNRLRKIDVEKMYQARAYMIQYPTEPCSLIELAHKIGTNEFALKRDFKAVFGTTVFQYWHTLRMSYAKELLAEGKNVSETAYLSGYKHATHFTAAFKKHFGIIPKDLKV